ncbi:hypothetical protein B0J14DRAFT_660839 [Halenospora varia]|nr:hypothetical protein B0J14DRAFT_660839 [Halenospora varia]
MEPSTPTPSVFGTPSLFGALRTFGTSSPFASSPNTTANGSSSSTNTTLHRASTTAKDDLANGERKIPEKIVATMMVRQSVLVVNSPLFAAMCAGGFMGSGKKIIDIEDDSVIPIPDVEDPNPGAVKIFKNFEFRLFEEVKNGENASTQTRRPATSSPIAIFQVSKAVLMQHSEHAKEKLAGIPDGKGGVAAYNNEEKTRMALQLAPKYIGGINRARFNLHNRITLKLWFHGDFLASTCNCKEQGLFAYCLGLRNTGAWPVAKVMHGHGHLSVKKAAAKLSTAKYISPNRQCGYCSRDYEGKTRRGVQMVMNNFDGLCLDCIRSGERKDVSNDGVSRGMRRWNGGCRMTHGQPTWYFSWLCSDKVRAEKKKREEAGDENVEATMAGVIGGLSKVAIGQGVPNS